SVQGDAYPPADPLRAGEGPGVVWHQRFELIDRIGGVVVMVRWLERRSGIVRASGDPGEAVPARIDPGRVVLRDDRVLTVFVPAGLDDQLRCSTGHGRVQALTLEQAVVDMAGSDIIDTGIALIRVREPVVVQRESGHQIVGPAHSEGLVVVPEDAPGNRYVGGVLANIDLAVADPGELTVVDPHMVGGVHPDTVVVVIVIL